MRKEAKKKKSTKVELKKLPEWDLNVFYKSIDSPAIEKDITKAEKLCNDFAQSYEGKVTKFDAETLGASIKEYEVIEDLLGKLASYAQLIYAGDMSNAEHGQFYQTIHEKVNELSALTLFFTLDINKLSDAAIKKFRKESSIVEHYWPWLREVRQFRPYQLDDNLEKLLHEKSVVGHAAWARLFDETFAAMRFPFKKKKLSSEEMIDKLSAADPKDRKEAAKSFGKGLGKQIHTYALIMNTIAKDKAIDDAKRGFERPIESRNIVNAVENEVVDALIDTVQQNYPNLSHRYYALKAKWFGQKKLDYWDRNAPLPDMPEHLYSWDDAQEIVLTSYQAFSPEMAKAGKKFFDKNWIDVPARQGKASGAFSHPTVPSANPYILLNYLGRPRDVMTLAHELGHGVHQLLAAEQGALMADTPLTLAETASVFGEQLTFRELLKRSENPMEYKALLAGKVEDMLNTVIRQIAFCQFEIRVHNERLASELTSERLGEIWLEVQRESLGKSIKFAPEYQYYWSYISHFIHTPFYVYAYAFGDCLVNSLYAVYQQALKDGKGKDFEQKYLTMLRSGGSLRHKELLAPFGLDASKPDFWQQGLDVISGMIDELETL